MITLKEALAKGKLKEFIRERSKEKGDISLFDKAISSMVGKSKATPATSAGEPCGNCNDIQTPQYTSKGGGKKRERESRE